MSMSDLIYSGNAGKRTRVIQLYQELEDHMRANFDATNELIELINKEFQHTGLTRIEVDSRKSIKENAEVLIGAIKKIQVLTDKIDASLSRHLEPLAYQKLMNGKTTFKDRYEIARGVANSSVSFISATTSANGVILISLIKGSIINVTPIVSIVGIGFTCMLFIPVLCLAVGFVASAFIRKLEKSRLEETITELEKAKNVFVPASKKYIKSINRVIARLELFQDNFNEPTIDY